MVLPVLPQDVIDEIISQVGENDSSTLKSCSLVCRSFRCKAQKMLFNPRTVVVTLVNGDNGPSEPTNIVLIVKHAPHLIGYIQQLTISGLSIDQCPLDFDASKSTDLVDALSVFSREGEFSINLDYLLLEDLQWTYIDPWLQDALVILMTIPSLRSICLEGVMDCPANLVQNLPPLLESLSLIETTFSSLPPTRKELPMLKSLTVAFIGLSNLRLDKFPIDAVERIVNVTQVKSFEGDVWTPSTMPVFKQILQSISNSLEHLTLEEIHIEDSDSISIDLNQFPRLTDITVDHICYGDDCIPVFTFIMKMMKKISHRNVIQSLSFCLSLGQGVDIHDFAFAMYRYDVWQEMDTICFIPQLASSKSFRGITFSMESTASDCEIFWDFIQTNLPKTREALKLHIETSLI